MSQPAAVAPAPEPVVPGRGPRWRTALSVVLIVVATVLSPIAVVSSWVKLELTSTDAFVQTFAPLASEPAVQRDVSASVVAAIEGEIDIDQLTQEAFDAVAGIDRMPPRAGEAIRSLSAPAAQGIKSMISTYVGDFVRSDAFQAVWEQALRTTHNQLVDAQDGSLAGGVVTVGQNGEIAVQLGPVIAEVKQILVSRGVPLADHIPPMNRSIVVATVHAAPTVRMAYQLAVDAGVWLPVVVLLLFAGAVGVANRHRRALVVSGVCLAVAMLLTGVAMWGGRIVTVSELAPRYLSASAARVIWEQTVVMLRSTVIATAALAVVVALVAWLGAPAGTPARVRGTVTDVAASVRSAAEGRGLTTGSVGTWLHAHRSLVLWALAVVSVVVMLASRPVTLGLVLWIAVVDLVVVLLVVLVERPPAGLPAT